MKKCPYCAEEIQDEAILCRYCKSDLTKPVSVQHTNEQARATTSEEKTIYEQGDVKITNLRAIFGEKTYSISNISSIELQQIEPLTCLAGIVAAVGFAMTVIALGSFFPGEGGDGATPEIGLFVVGIILTGYAISASRSGRKKYRYSIVISTSSEVVNMSYDFEDKDHAHKIVESVNLAIAQKR